MPYQYILCTSFNQSAALVMFWIKPRLCTHTVDYRTIICVSAAHTQDATQIKGLGLHRIDTDVYGTLGLRTHSAIPQRAPAPYSGIRNLEHICIDGIYMKLPTLQWQFDPLCATLSPRYWPYACEQCICIRIRLNAARMHCSIVCVRPNAPLRVKYISRRVCYVCMRYFMALCAA